MLDKSTFFYVFELLFVESAFFVFDNRFFFFRFSFFDFYLSGIMFLIIDLEFACRVEKIVSHYLGNEGDESEFGDAKKCDYDKNDKYNDSKHNTYTLCSSLEGIEYSHRCSYPYR